MFTPESERKFVAAFDQYFEALIPQTKIGKAQAVTKKGRDTSSATIEKINAIEVPFGEAPGRATESGQTPRRPCLLYTSPSPRDRQKSRMPSSA